MGITYGCVPAILRVARGIAAVEVDEREWEQLAQYRRQRFILTPNHPSASDPLIALWVARRLRSQFNYLACRELFDHRFSWFLQRIGCYSILRGALDREAVRTTLSLLAEQDRQVVIFPEGEIYGHNDMLLPFQSGVVQMGFMALDRLEKAGKELTLPVVPLVVKYLHQADARPAIRAGVERLEAALELPHPPPPSVYFRLRRIGETVLTTIEREYRLRPPPGQHATERANAVKGEILRRVAAALDVPGPTGHFAAGLHELLNAVHVYGEEFAAPASPYEERLHRRRLAAVVPLYDDLWRLQNMLAVSDGYVAAHMTTERFVEVLNRLEAEVLGAPRTLVRSRALLRVVEPLELGTRLAHYRQSRRAAIAAATGELEQAMRARMEEVARMGTPLAADPA